MTYNFAIFLVCNVGASREQNENLFSIMPRRRSTSHVIASANLQHLFHITKLFYSLIPKITSFCGVVFQKSRHFMELYFKNHADIEKIHIVFWCLFVDDIIVSVVNERGCIKI